MAIAKHLILKYVGVIVLSWQRLPGFWLKCSGTWWNKILYKKKLNWIELIMPLIFTRAPGPLAAKLPQSINGPPPYLTVGMRCFFLRMHPSFDTKPCWLCTWPKSYILVSSDHSTSHSSKNVCQTQDSWICWLLSVSAFFVQPFQRACWYGGGVLWLILRLCDSKTMQLKFCSSWSSGPWVLLCLPHHLPHCAWGQHALASSSLQVCNCSRYVKLFDYCPNTCSVVCSSCLCIFCTHYLTCVNYATQINLTFL